MNPAMCRKAKSHATDRGTVMECHEGAMEAIPVPDDSVDAVISNGVINLSFRKRKVVEELGRTLDVSRILGDGRQPVDRDVFMRELAYYQIRAASR